MIIKRLSKLLRVVMGRDLFVSATIQRNKIWYGSDYGGFYICPDKLTKNSVIYSFGIGKDISFDLELIDKHKCRIFGFDPTPKSIAWMASQKVPPQFQLYPYGIAVNSGQVDFFLPMNEDYVSGSLVKHRSIDQTRKLTIPVKSFKDITEELSHKKVDVLKMDIEGAEYEVLPNILNSACSIDQILVEFHHRMMKGGIQKTRETIQVLKNNGFEIFAVSKTGEEISFIRKT